MTQEVKTVRRRIKEREIQAYFCDCCNKRLPVEDWIEMQEMLHWRMRGGYGSAFGDGAEISLDLCQECTKKLLGDYIQVDVSNAY
jgi:uncharacterized protein YlaI